MKSSMSVASLLFAIHRYLSNSGGPSCRILIMGVDDGVDIDAHIAVGASAGRETGNEPDVSVFALVYQQIKVAAIVAARDVEAIVSLAALHHLRRQIYLCHLVALSQINLIPERDC